MTGAVVEFDHQDFMRVQAALDRLIDAGQHPRRLLEQLAGGVESQTRRRIGQTKTAPDGRRWAAWSAAYAATRGPGKSLLQSEGDLLDSIVSDVHDDTAEVGSNLVYAATQQFGDDDRGIPARPYLGISRRDHDELERLIEDFGGDLLR